jgi:hypothetical protein
MFKSKNIVVTDETTHCKLKKKKIVKQFFNSTTSNEFDLSELRITELAV